MNPCRLPVKQPSSAAHRLDHIGDLVDVLRLTGRREGDIPDVRRESVLGIRARRRPVCLNDQNLLTPGAGHVGQAAPERLQPGRCGIEGVERDAHHVKVRKFKGSLFQNIGVPVLLGSPVPVVSLLAHMVDNQVVVPWENIFREALTIRCQDES